MNPSPLQEGSENKDTRLNMRDPLRVTLVIPLRNEQDSFGLLTRSICQQTRIPDEVILVDGGSTDNTLALARELTETDEHFQLIEAGPATPGRGRNVGIEAASHNWIALADAGMILERTWMDYLLEVVEQDRQVQVVYGNYEPICNSFFERCAALTYVSAKQERPGGRMRGPFVASSLIHRNVWKNIGGFPDLRAAEDLMFMERIEQAGFKIGWAPRATVHWQLRPTLMSTFQKFTLYSKHNVLAKRERYWHYGVFRQHLLVLPFFLLAIFWNPMWLLVPVLWFCTRIAKSIWQKQEGQSVLTLFNPFQFLLVGFILLTIDLATYVGWVQALWQLRVQSVASILTGTVRE